MRTSGMLPTRGSAPGGTPSVGYSRPGGGGALCCASAAAVRHGCFARCAPALAAAAGRQSPVGSAPVDQTRFPRPGRAAVASLVAARCLQAWGLLAPRRVPVVSLCWELSSEPSRCIARPLPSSSRPASSPGCLTVLCLSKTSQTVSLCVCPATGEAWVGQLPGAMRNPGQPISPPRLKAIDSKR